MRDRDYTREELCRFRQRTDLPAKAKLIALHLLDRDGPGGSFPTVNELCAVAECKERNTQYLLRRLEAAGVVVVEYNAGGNGAYRGDRRPNRYTVDLFATGRGVQPIAPRNDADGVQPIAPRKPHGVQPIAPNGVQPIAPKRKKENVRKDDDARVRVHASDPAPSSSSGNWVPIASTAQKAARQIAAAKGRSDTRYWQGIIRNWRSERDDDGFTMLERIERWLRAGMEQAAVIERVIRDAPLTDPPPPVLRPIGHPRECICHGEGVVKVDDRGQGTYDRCRGVAIAQ